MFTPIKLAPGLLAVALAAAAFALPALAGAQTVPSYADSGYGNDQETIHGRVYAIDGTFDLRLSDDRGFIDHVHLHQGTIINPTGLTLAPGMTVTIAGYSAGSVFEANEIDTPYSYDGSAPAPVYYGPGWWCPGYGYGYGPAFSLALVFGGGGWYYAHHPWSGHWYDDRPWNGGSTNGPPPSGRRSYGAEPRSIAPEGGTTFQAPAAGRVAPLPELRRSSTPPTYTRAPQATYRGGPAAASSGSSPSTYHGSSPSTYHGGSPSTYRGGSPSTSHGGSPSTYHGDSTGGYHGGPPSTYHSDSTGGYHGDSMGGYHGDSMGSHGGPNGSSALGGSPRH